MTHTRIPAPELRPARPRALRRSLVLAAAVDDPTEVDDQADPLLALLGGRAPTQLGKGRGEPRHPRARLVGDREAPAFDRPVGGGRLVGALGREDPGPRVLLPVAPVLVGRGAGLPGRADEGDEHAEDGDGSTTPPDAIATCAVVPTAATGSQVLATAGAVRVDKGLVCGVAGYPAAGCGGAVAAMSDAQKGADTPLVMPTTTSPTTSPAAKTAASSAAASASVSTAVTTTAATAGGSGATVWILVVLALALVGLAVVTMRRRRPAGV